MLSLVRDADGSYPLVYGTIVDAAGTTRRLDRDAFEVQVTDHWTSPTTGATYPAGWRVTIPGEGLAIDLTRRSPTRSSTRGRRPASSTGRDRRSCRRRAAPTRLGGEGYVELTGYAPSNGAAN